MNRAPETAKGFDYMQAGKDSSQTTALAQEYMDKLLDESAPASYLPMLAKLAKTTALPVAIRVCVTLIVWSVCLNTCIAKATSLWFELLMSLLELLMRCDFIVTAVPDGCAKAVIRCEPHFFSQKLNTSQANKPLAVPWQPIYVRVNTVQNNQCCLLSLSMLRLLQCLDDTHGP